MIDNDTYQITDELWEQIKPLVPPAPPRIRRNGLRIDDRSAMNAMFYVLRTRCKWEELPHDMGEGDAVYVRFREWRKTGVFDRMWQAGILTYDELRTLVSQNK